MAHIYIYIYNSEKVLGHILPFTNKVTYFRDKKFGLLKVNSDCDGERDSYDAMVLLTGRLDLTDVPGLNEQTKEHQPSI